MGAPPVQEGNCEKEKSDYLVGWVEGSDTQQLQTIGFALLNPSYAG
jgi:hypothetical protein